MPSNQQTMFSNQQPLPQPHIGTNPHKPLIRKVSRGGHLRPDYTGHQRRPSDDATNILRKFSTGPLDQNQQPHFPPRQNTVSSSENLLYIQPQGSPGDWLFPPPQMDLRQHHSDTMLNQIGLENSLGSEVFSPYHSPYGPSPHTSNEDITGTLDQSSLPLSLSLSLTHIRTPIY